MPEERATIAALASAPYPAAIAVVRVSGPQARLALRAVFRGKRDPLDHPREMILGELIDFNSGQVIDLSLSFFMPKPHSFTGEDVVEFQFHGSMLLAQRVLRSLYAYGVAPAEPGEFTRRAFLNGKLDLVQAEAIADLIQATSEHALRIANAQLKGKFSKAVEELGEPLRDALAAIEAGIDFPDEGIPPADRRQVLELLETVRERIGELLKSYDYGHLVKEGYRVLLCGRPNVGKSSLLNLLLGRKRAIVSEISGTTRDLIEEEAIIGGYRFVLCDSAGITESSDTVEKIGIELARDRVQWADLVLLVTEAVDAAAAWKELLYEIHPSAAKIWLIVNKTDLNPGAIGSIICDSKYCARNFYLSAKTAQGVDALREALVDEVTSSISQHSDAAHIVTNERQRTCLARAHQAVDRCFTILSEEAPLEILSVEIRAALSSLEELVGKTWTEDILGRIFSKFCIGK